LGFTFTCLGCVFWLAAWRSGDAFHPINKITLRRTGLVFGLVTACGQINHLGM